MIVKAKNSIQKSERKFALMLLLLLAIMGIAPASILGYVHATQAAGEAINPRIMTMAILLLTAGFLFMAGGLGMWAFRSSMTAELQRTIGKFVDAMDYLNDGLLCIAPDARILAANPAIRKMAHASATDESQVKELFPELSEKDLHRLLNPKAGTEIEQKVYRNGSSMTLRFRSQSEEGHHLLLVSDITEQQVKQREIRQQAHLQFIGRIARGVAHDFNNILCAISGHAALLERKGMDPEDKNSIQTILRETDRGAALARRLMELSRKSPQSESKVGLRTMIANTEDLIKVALSSGNHLAYSLEDTELSVSLGPSQVEQIIANLSVLTSDLRPSPSTLHVQLKSIHSDTDGVAPVAMLSIFAESANEKPDSEIITSALEEIDRTGGDGVILSVVASQVEEIGGTLLKLKRDKQDIGFRILFPGEKGNPSTMQNSVGNTAWRDEFKNWTVLLGLHGSERKSEAMEFAAGESLQVSVCEDLPALLSQLEKSGAWQLIIIDEDVLAMEGDAILRVITRLHPQTPLVALTSSPDEPTLMATVAQAFQLSKNISFPQIFSTAQEWLADEPKFASPS